jgi:hypothetical protein
MAMSVGRKTRNAITSNVTFNEGIGAGMIEIEKISNLEKKIVPFRSRIVSCGFSLFSAEIAEITGAQYHLRKKYCLSIIKQKKSF